MTTPGTATIKVRKSPTSGSAAGPLPPCRAPVRGLGGRLASRVDLPQMDRLAVIWRAPDPR